MTRQSQSDPSRHRGPVSAFAANRLALLGLAASVLALTSGCVERYFRVETKPADADVYINGAYVGRSPVERPFTYYGTFRVDVHHSPDRHPASYEPATELVEVERPWYQLPVLDLFAELVDPRTHVDRHVHVVELTEVPPVMTRVDRGPEDAALRERAEAVRSEAR